MIYLDASALLKLLVGERETAALGSWLSARRDEPRLTSELSVVEVGRAYRRLSTGTGAPARSLLPRLDLLPLSRDVLERAIGVGWPLLRSLDAVHLASALSVPAALTGFVAYDHRLADAAEVAGLPVVRPGA